MISFARKVELIIATGDDSPSASTVVKGTEFCHERPHTSPSYSAAFSCELTDVAQSIELA